MTQCGTCVNHFWFTVSSWDWSVRFFLHTHMMTTPSVQFRIVVSLIGTRQINSIKCLLSSNTVYVKHIKCLIASMQSMLQENCIKCLVIKHSLCQSLTLFTDVQLDICCLSDFFCITHIFMTTSSVQFLIVVSLIGTMTN